MMMLILMQFIAFPEKEDALLAKNANGVQTEVSGSLGLYYNRKCHQTYPNETFHEDRKMDWCSNVVSPNSGEKPWIQYHIKNKKIQLKSFAIRNGCCYHPCCCLDDNTIYDYECCCILHSFSLLGSDDNKTWVTLHKEEKVKDFWSCQSKTFELEKESPYFNFIRLVQDAPYPGCIFCMQINQVELYGRLSDSIDVFGGPDDLDDESVSIIGKIRKGNNDA